MDDENGRDMSRQDTLICLHAISPVDFTWRTWLSASVSSVSEVFQAQKALDARPKISETESQSIEKMNHFMQTAFLVQVQVLFGMFHTWSRGDCLRLAFACHRQSRHQCHLSKLPGFLLHLKVFTPFEA